jgi:hypothetical protein
MISRLCDWLVATPISQAFQTLPWFVPLVQTVHILGIAVVVTSVGMTDFKLLGFPRNGQSLSAMVSQLMPWIWFALGVLLVTGTLLTITEPARELQNVAFRLKMLLILGLISILMIVRSGVRRDPEYWTGSPRRKSLARSIGAVSLLLVTSIVVAGRWIAYV